MRQSSQFSECARLNQQFRKEIRRKDIEQRFAERRKQLLQQQRHLFNNGKYEQMGPMLESSRNEIQQIYSRYLNNNRISGKDLYYVSNFSCKLEGTQDIIKSNREFINYLIEEYVLKETYNETQELNLVLLLLNNCLTITSCGYAKEPIKNSQYNKCSGFNNSSLNNQYYINAITSTEQFILRVFTIALQTKSCNIKQNAMSVIFCIVYNNEPNFIHTLVTNPKFSIMSLLFNQMHTQPRKSVVMQVFRCYHLIMKKLQYAPLEQFSKMRKFVIFVIKNSNSFQISMISTACLQLLLKTLPNQRPTISKSGILTFVFERALFHKKTKLIGAALKIASYMIQVRNYQQMKTILRFIEQCFCNSQFSEHQNYCLKLLYDILVSSTVSADQFISNQPKLFGKMIELFDQNTTSKDILLDISYTLCLLGIKSKKMNKEICVKISTRVQQILQNWDLDKKSMGFLQHALQMLGSIDRNSDI